MTSQNTIYTIQTNTNSSASITQIETVITRGLYRFTLLGMDTKQASDTKDRVYAALRSSNLLNLKSDNRKIIVEIFPEITTKKESFCDLAIALSCIYSVEKKIFPCNILAVGGLSISGKIVGTKRLYQAIYTAYIERIPVIVCSEEDMVSLDAQTVADLQYFNITILSDSHLQGIISKIKGYKHETPNNQNITPTKIETNKLQKDNLIRLADMDTVLRALYISLCGGHPLILETCSTHMFKTLYKKVYTYIYPKHLHQRFYTHHTKQTFDNIAHADVTYIENITDITSKDVLKKKEGVLIGTYYPCPCEHAYSFFDTHVQGKRCICSKRNLIQHKRHIENTYFHIFHMKEVHTEHIKELDDSIVEHIHLQIHKIRGLQYNRFTQEHAIEGKDLYFFGDESYLNSHKKIEKPTDMLTPEAYTVWENTQKDDRVLYVAQTIEDIWSIEADTSQEKRPAISKQALLLSLSYIPKMDS